MIKFFVNLVFVLIMMLIMILSTTLVIHLSHKDNKDIYGLIETMIAGGAFSLCFILILDKFRD